MFKQINKFMKVICKLTSLYRYIKSKDNNR